MYKVYFYKDRKGNQPVKEYINKLASGNGKENRIKVCKIREYLELLKKYGTRIGEPYVKHLEDEIWELRPFKDRILFVAWVDNSFVLLHQFRKKTQKTPRREIEKAKKEFADLKERREINE